jgi:hypothetical protein
VTKRVLPITVVIATLGGKVLNQTIACLNQGEGVPAEILICIPEVEAANANCVTANDSVHVIQTPCRGQVAQRAFGLRMVSQPFAMQLDDDVILPADTLAALYAALLEKGPGHVVAPFFRTQLSGEHCTRYVEGFRGFVRNCHASLICGAAFGKQRMGCIAPCGIGFGVPMSRRTERLVESEWLPGGVALCHTTDLITSNYYPFVGKAYSEDLIHSILWRSHGCQLWTALDVSAMIDVSVESFVWSSVMARYRAHVYVAMMVGTSVWRTRLWFVFYCFLHLRELMEQNTLDRCLGIV